MIFSNPKKAYFKQLLKGVHKMIWDLEFKQFKTREIRESVRVQYDDCKMKLALAKTKVEQEEKEPTMDPAETARIKDQMVLLERDMERYLGQMKTMDLDVNGAAPTNENPDGVVGIVQQLDSLQELKLMVKDYIKSL